MEEAGRILAVPVDQEQNDQKQNDQKQNDQKQNDQKQNDQKQNASQGSQGGSQTMDVHGNLVRPLVPEGARGARAVEEGSFTLRPGDMLEIECAIPHDMATHMLYKSDDEEIVKLIPAGVRQLKPVAMVGGKPKPITGMLRFTAIFQAQQKTGKTVIRLNLGEKQYQYNIEVQ